MKNKPVFSLEHITKAFGSGHTRLEVIKEASLSIHQGEMVALIGPSGSGKSTLLQIAGLLDNPDKGIIRLEDKDCTNLNDTARTALRRDHIGFVYQFHHLLPEFSALENVMMPQMIQGKATTSAQNHAEHLLSSLGLAERLTHRPSELSGGEQQRVAIARALANKPLVILADEPTGNLDPATADMVFKLLVSSAKQSGHAAFIVTHNMQLASYMDRVVTLKDGVLVEQ